jgi:hypothetical protein
MVIDHERVQLKFPEGDGVLELGVIYEIRDGKIVRVTATPPRRGAGEKLSSTRLACGLILCMTLRNRQPRSARAHPD